MSDLFRITIVDPDTDEVLGTVNVDAPDWNVGDIERATIAGLTDGGRGGPVWLSECDRCRRVVPDASMATVSNIDGDPTEYLCRHCQEGD